MMQRPPMQTQPKKERAKLNDVLRFKNIYYRVRKITKRDILIRPMSDVDAKLFLEKKGHVQ